MANVSTSTLSLPDLQLSVFYQNWPASVGVLVISLLAIFIKATWQPAYPKDAPKVVSEWPILGALRLYKDRRDFFLEAANRTNTGNFSTYVGKHQIVGVKGPEARKSFFEAKELDMTEG